MILITLSILLCVTFLVLSGFHFYWIFGGTWGVKKVIPTKTNGVNSFTIPKFGTLIVALVLVVFGLVYLAKSEFITIPYSFTKYAYWCIPAIFILRGIGEFKYVGFFKTIKNTEFAKADTKLFSPLCIMIGFIGFIIQFIS